MGQFSSCGQSKEAVERFSAHILPELGGVDIVNPFASRSGNRIAEGKKPTLKADPHKLIGFAHAPGRFLHADLLHGRGNLFQRCGPMPHQKIKGHAGCIGQRLDPLQAGGVLPGKILTDCGLGNSGQFGKGRLLQVSLFHCVFQTLYKGVHAYNLLSFIPNTDQPACGPVPGQGSEPIPSGLAWLHLPFRPVPPHNPGSKCRGGNSG